MLINPKSKIQNPGAWTLKTSSGSALLIAILVMGILMTLTLGLSDLIIREIIQTNDLVAAGKAYFAAEAGVENALLDLREHLPGYETPADGVKSSAGGLDYQYKILNRADKIPYFEPDKPVFLKPDEPAYSSSFLYSGKPRTTYNALPLNETAVIPLYTDDGGGHAFDVKDFLVEYYVDFGADRAQWLVSDLAKVDILRWKIFGRPKNSPDDTPKTDAISDFFPAPAAAGASSPVCIGTDQSLQPTEADQHCIFPILSTKSAGPQNVSGLWSAARECYLSDAKSAFAAGGNNSIQTGTTGCSMKDFIESHTQNYLVLINVINPEVIGITNPEFAKEKTTIYYRIVAKAGQNEPKLARESALIRADGYAANGRVKQSIDAQVGAGSFFPVFNFSLYQTK